MTDARSKVARIAALAGTGLLTFTLTACGGSGGGASTPEAAVDELWDAVAAEDGETACGLVYADGETFDEWDAADQDECVEDINNAREEMEGEMPGLEDPDEFFSVFTDAELETVEEGDGEATVEMEVSFMGMTEALPVETVEVDGGWYIADMQGASPGGI